jgi:hypothetical protein
MATTKLGYRIDDGGNKKTVKVRYGLRKSTGAM